MKDMKQESFFFKNREIIILSAIIFFAIFLRIYNLNELTGGDDSQFGEFVSIGIHSAQDLFYNHFPDDYIAYRDFKYTRPATYIPLFLSVSVFGNTPFALLIPALICTAISIILLYFLIKSLFDDKTAVYAAVIFAFSPFHIMFSRNALLHPQLTMLWLGSSLLFFYAIKKQKPQYIYLSMLLCIFSQYTTDYRGLVPLVGLVAYYLLSKPNRRMTKHIIIAGVSFAIFVISYVMLPAILYGDYGYIGWYYQGFLEGTGNFLPLSWLEVFKLDIGMLAFTPFVGIIIVPMLFGLYLTIRSIRKPQNAFLIVALLSLGVFILSRQKFFERLVIYTPIFAALAAIGIRAAEKQFEISSISKHLILLFSSTLFYIILIPFFMKTFLRTEYLPVIAQLNSMGLAFLVSTGATVIFLISIALGTFFIIFFADKKKKYWPFIQKSVIFLFLLLIIIVPTLLVVAKVGEYDRPDGVYAISKYLLEHKEHEKYVCLAGCIYDKAVIYYTRQICMCNAKGDYDAIMVAIKSKNVKYVLFDSKFGTESAFQLESPKLYEYIMANSKNITKEIPGRVDMDKFSVLEIINQ
jgi:hypothetical protein